jgi:UDP-N-acetylmuramoyl-L-alanyl-D-glutamate--2,6-diaminopimelate ligase
MPGDARSRPDLARLAAVVGGRVSGDGAVVPDDVRHDSRSVGAGDLFVARRGARSDGHDFAAAAVERGAAALCVEHLLDLPVPQLVVADARRALPALAAEVHGHPAESLTVIGVTGTNGKTTVTYMLEAIVSAAGRRAGVVGTVGARIAGTPAALERTTPESSDLQRLLRAMVDAGVDVAALEVSSHALRLGRVDGIVFDVAAFTNLSQDHLDFHGTMEDYFATKATLFTPSRARRGVVCIDDDHGRRLAASATVPVTTVAVGAAGDVTATDVDLTPDGSTFVLGAGDGAATVRLPLAGSFNVANAAVAGAAAVAAGIDLETVRRGLEALPGVPGRFESVRAGQDFAVIVDYAHTPDAVASVITQARRLCDGRVIAVLGAGGDRDRAKRPAMGAALASADVAVVTSDNPRSEDPDAIIAAVLAGATGAGDAAEIVVEPDRRSAIAVALGRARHGDVVLVLGKGHEQGQEFAAGSVPFDDREVAAQLVHEMAAGGERS